MIEIILFLIVCVVCFTVLAYKWLDLIGEGIDPSEYINFLKSKKNDTTSTEQP